MAQVKPNIILIMTDDQLIDTIEHMPVLNREIIQKGINFTNGFVTTPLCCPSRASILSGQYAHTHGVRDNRLPLGGATLFDDAATIAVWLKEAGYRTALMGKYLNEYNAIEPYGYIPPGWDDWYVFLKGERTHRYYYDYEISANGSPIQYGTNPKDYSTDMLAEKAVDFIKQSKDRPFFLVYSPYNPHLPITFAKRHSSLFRSDEDFLSRRGKLNFYEEDISDKPEWFNLIPVTNPEDAINAYQRTLRSMMSVDEAIDNFVKILEKSGLRDNTVIIFISDNGFCLGEHRLVYQKNCGYEECIRVPFVISYPAMISDARVEDRLVLNVDLAPTIAELAGVESLDDVNAFTDGVSLVPLLRNTVQEWRDGILIEHWRLAEGFGGQIPDFAGIRTILWKYVEYDTGEKELYDMKNDPYEMDNLASMDQYQAIMAELAEQLKALKGEQLALWSAYRSPVHLMRLDFNPDLDNLPDE